MTKNWIAGAIGKPGALHKSLHVHTGDTIPVGRLKTAAHSENPTMAKRANLALTLRKFHGRHGGEK